MAVATEDKVKVHIPDLDVSITDQREELVDFLTEAKDTYGFTTLLNNIEKFTFHKNLADRAQSIINESIARLNGERTQPQKKGDSTRSMRKTAEKFFSAMNEARLESYCAMYGLNYNDYSTIEGTIEALVEKHLELNG